MGSAAYGLAFASYILDSPIIKASSLESHHPGQADYLTDLCFQLQCGTIVNTVLGMEINTVNRCYVYGTKGYIAFDNFWKSQALTLMLNNRESVTYDFPYPSEFTFYLDHVSDLLRNNKKESPIMTHQLTLQSMKYLDDLFKQYLADSLLDCDR